MKYNYDPESNILTLKIANRPYEYAEEMGDFIVHFDKKNKPVYIEVLNANKFIKKAVNVLPKSSIKEFYPQISV